MLTVGTDEVSCTPASSFGLPDHRKYRRGFHFNKAAGPYAWVHVRLPGRILVGIFGNGQSLHSD